MKKQFMIHIDTDYNALILVLVLQNKAKWEKKKLI